MTNFEKTELAKVIEALGSGLDDYRWRPGETAVDAILREHRELSKQVELLEAELTKLKAKQ